MYGVGLKLVTPAAYALKIDWSLAGEFDDGTKPEYAVGIVTLILLMNKLCTDAEPDVLAVAVTTIGLGAVPLFVAVAVVAVVEALQFTVAVFNVVEYHRGSLALNWA